MLSQLSLRNILPTQLHRWLKRAYAQATRLRWDIILVISVVHFILSYLLLYWAEETALLQFNTFWYFYITTATTVGYGDLSPELVAGRYIVTLFVMPGGITLFTTIIAKLVQDATNTWRKRMKGLKNYQHLQDHIVVIGWREQRTLRMLELIRGDASEEREILLVADLAENPSPDNDVQFVKAHNLSSPEALQRAATPKASLVVVLGHDDNETFTAALAAGAIYQGHMVAYFEHANYADLLEQHCPNAEPVVSLSIESTVRTAQDPGSSQLISQLLSNLEGQTQYRLTIPEQQSIMSYGELFSQFKNVHDATLLGIGGNTAHCKIQLNPPSTIPVKPGTSLYYMAAKRLKPTEIHWQSAQNNA